MTYSIVVTTLLTCKTQGEESHLCDDAAPASNIKPDTSLHLQMQHSQQIVMRDSDGNQLLSSEAQ